MLTPQVKLKGDGSYFFHHTDDYWKYLTAKDKNDIDGDGIPNDIEEKYGLNMFYAGDAGEDWDNDNLTNYEELIKYAPLFGVLNITNPDSDKDGYNDGYEVKVPGLHPKNPDVDGDGLLDGKNEDGDPFTNWFERNKMLTDPLVKNERYAIIVDALTPEYYVFMNGTGMRNFLIKEFGYKSQNVILLNSNKATFKNLKQTINNLKERVSSNDILLVILSAHGGPNVMHLPNRSTWYSDVADTLKDIDIERMIVNLDACYSGSAIKFFKNETFHSSLLLYTSTDEKTEAISVIDSVLKDMTEKETDFNNDGFVSFHEAYVREYEWATNGSNKFYPQEYDPNKIANYTYLGEKAVVD